jgi:D-alanine-D-alanine ligase-like ATP-grasp enzyme
MTGLIFFSTDSGGVLNEINTIPGLPVSACTQSYGKPVVCISKLVDRLIELALERKADHQKLNIGMR